MVAALRFPDAQALDEWYLSDAYPALVELRDAAAEMTFLTLDDVDPGVARS